MEQEEEQGGTENTAESPTASSSSTVNTSLLPIPLHQATKQIDRELMSRHSSSSIFLYCNSLAPILDEAIPLHYARLSTWVHQPSEGNGACRPRIGGYNVSMVLSSRELFGDAKKRTSEGLVLVGISA